MGARAVRTVDSPGPAGRRAGRHLLFAAGEIIVLGVLLALAVVIRGHPGPLPGDADIEVGVQHDLLHRGIVTQALEGLSTLNWPVPTIITLAVIVALFLLLRRWLDAGLPPVAAGVSSLFTLYLSRWVHRPRPSGHGVHPIQHITSTFSFPSGHVTYAVTIFGLFLYFTTQVRRPIHPAVLWFIRVVLILIILLMPVSRVLEGEHWPSDVLGGALDGLFWLLIFTHLYQFARARWPQLLARDER